MVDTLHPPLVAPSRRRSSESPTLWLLLLAGSILLHVVLFLLLRPLTVERAGGQGGEGPIAIEVVNAVSETGQTSLPAASTKTGAITPTPIAAPPPPALENAQDIQAPPRSPDKLASPPPSTQPSTQALPNASPLQGKLERRTPEIAAPPPSLPLSPSPKSEPLKPPKPPEQPNSQTKIATSGERLADPAVPPVPPQVESSSLPENGVTVPPIVPPEAPSVNQELRLTIVGDPRPVQTRDPLTPYSDNPDHFAQVIGSASASFSGIPVSPCVRGSFGRRLELRLTIDKDGIAKTDDMAGGQPSSCTIEAVNKFAKDLVRQKIRFLPARNGGGKVESIIYLDVKLSLV